MIGGPQDITLDDVRRYLETLTDAPIASVQFGEVRAPSNPSQRPRCWSKPPVSRGRGGSG